MKIVIVDDDKQAAYDLEARLLKSYKIEVAGVALNGLDGLALVNKHRPVCCFSTCSCLIFRAWISLTVLMILRMATVVS